MVSKPQGRFNKIQVYIWKACFEHVRVGILLDALVCK